MHGAPMRIERIPRPDISGTRVGWKEYSSRKEHLIQHAVTGFSLDPDPPVDVPGLQVMPRRADARAVPAWTERRISAGLGAAYLKRSRSRWASPFIVGLHGSPATCLHRYDRWFQHQKYLHQPAEECSARNLVGIQS